ILEIALPGIRLELLDSERQPVGGGVDIQNHRLNDHALFEYFVRVLDPLGPGKIADVHQPVDPFLDLDKCPEIGHVADTPFHHAAHAVAGIDGGPRIGLQLLQPQRNAALLGMYLEHHGLHLIAALHHFRRMFHPPRPGHLADVNEALDAGFQLDKSAVVGNVHYPADDAPVHRIAFRHRFPGVGLELLETQRDPLLGAAEFQHFDATLLAYLQHLVRMLNAAIAHVRNV